MTRRPTFLAVAAIALTAAAALAEKANMSPEKLRDTATHVIAGRVTAVYERTETEGDYRYTRYVAEVRIEESEKGEGLEPGTLAYVRYWKRAWIGEGQVPPSTNGHRGLPKEGQRYRIYLARDAYDGFGTDSKDGGFNVIGANGFEQLGPESKD